LVPLCPVRLLKIDINFTQMQPGFESHWRSAFSKNRSAWIESRPSIGSFEIREYRSIPGIVPQWIPERVQLKFSVREIR